MAVGNERFGIDVILNDKNFQSGVRSMIASLKGINTQASSTSQAGTKMGTSFKGAISQMGNTGNVESNLSRLSRSAVTTGESGTKMGATFRGAISQMGNTSNVTQGLNAVSTGANSVGQAGTRMGTTFRGSLANMGNTQAVTTGLGQINAQTTGVINSGARMSNTFSNSLRNMGNTAPVTQGLTSITAQSQRVGEAGGRMSGTFTNSFSRMAGTSHVVGGLGNITRSANEAGQSGNRMGEAFSRAGSRGLSGMLADSIRRVRDNSNEASDSGMKMDSIFSKLSSAAVVALTTAIAGAAAATAAAIKTGMSYTQQMSKVEAISGSTSVQMAELGSNARKLGADTRWSATNVAEAYEYMAMAGWNSNQMLDASLPLLNLATAGALDLGRAADIVTDTMTPFGLAASEAGRVADVFAVAQSKANLNVNMLGETMKYAAPIAATFGASLEETTAVAMQFANGGIKASMAGTALRAGLSRLAEPPKPAAKALAKLNVETVKQDGTMKSLTQIIGELSPKFQNLTNQQQVAAAKAIFGEEAYAGWVMVLKNGLPEFERMTGLLHDSGGAAEKMAGIMANNLSGAMDNASSAAENLGLILFSRIEGGLVAATNGSIGWMESLAKTIDPMNNLVEATKLLQMEEQKYAQTMAVLNAKKAEGSLSEADYTQKKKEAEEQLKRNTTETGIYGQKIQELDAQLQSGAINQEQYDKKKQEAEGFSKNLAATIEQEKKKQEELGEKIKWLQGLWDQLWKILKPIWDNMAKFIKEQYDKIVKFIDENSKEIEATWKALWWLIETFIVPIWDGVKKVISGALDIIMGIIKVFGGIMNGDWEKVWEGVKDILGGALDIILGLFDMAFLKTLIKAPLKFGKDILLWAKDTFMKLVRDIGDWLKKLPTLSKEQFGDMLKAAVNGIKDLPSKVMKIFKDLMKDLKDISWFDVGRKIVQSLIDGLVSLAWKVGSEVGNIASKMSPLNLFRSAPDTPIGNIGGGQMRSAFGEGGLAALPQGFMQSPDGFGGLSKAMAPMMATLDSINSLTASSKSSPQMHQFPTPQNNQAMSVTVEVPVYLDKYQIASATGEVNQTELNRLSNRKLQGSGGSKYF